MENDGESFLVGFSQVMISSLNPTEEAITTKSRCVFELLKAALIGQLVLIPYNPGQGLLSSYVQYINIHNSEMIEYIVISYIDIATYNGFVLAVVAIIGCWLQSICWPPLCIIWIQYLPIK